MASPYGIPNKSTGNDNSETFDFGGRSYVSMSYKPSLLSSSLVNTGVEVHEQTANLASVLVTESLNEDENEDDLEQQQQQQHHREEESQDHQHSLSESSLLMSNSPRNNYFSQADALESEIGSPSVNSFGRRSHSGSNPSVNSSPNHHHHHYHYHLKITSLKNNQVNCIPIWSNQFDIFPGYFLVLY